MKPGEELVEEPFQRLAAAAARHLSVRGFWACMDTFKDKRARGSVQPRPDAVGGVEGQDGGPEPCRFEAGLSRGCAGCALRARAGESRDWLRTERPEMPKLPFQSFAPPSARCSVSAHTATTWRLGAAGPCSGSPRKTQASGVHVDGAQLQTPPAKRRRGQSAAALLRVAPGSRIIIRKFRDGFLPYEGAQVKETFEELKHGPSPDLILTHYRGDLHQDHRLISELTWNTFRNHLILEYEIPKYDGDLGDTERLRAGRRIALSAKDRHDPREALRARPASDGYSEDLFRALLRMRGMEATRPVTMPRRSIAESSLSARTMSHDCEDGIRAMRKRRSRHEGGLRVEPARSVSAVGADDSDARS